MDRKKFRRMYLKRLATQYLALPVEERRVLAKASYPQSERDIEMLEKYLANPSLTMRDLSKEYGFLSEAENVRQRLTRVLLVFIKNLRRKKWLKYTTK